MAIELTRQRKVAYGIVGFLAVILVVVLVYSQFTSAPTLTTVEPPVAAVGGLSSDQASQPFDVSPLEAPGYTQLNRALLESGRLPVPPPALRGKPNPFGI